MNDWIIRIGLASIAGLTYLAGALPTNMHITDISQLPLQTWLYFSINVLSGIFSPSLVKATIAKTGLTK